LWWPCFRERERDSVRRSIERERDFVVFSPAPAFLFFFFFSLSLSQAAKKRKSFLFFLGVCEKRAS
jgi:hypothetical protein